MARLVDLRLLALGFDRRGPGVLARDQEAGVVTGGTLSAIRNYLHFMGYQSHIRRINGALAVWIDE